MARGTRGGGSARPGRCDIIPTAYEPGRADATIGPTLVLGEIGDTGLAAVLGWDEEVCEPMVVVREGFEYEFSRLAPGEGAHIDPPSIAVYETLVAKGPDRGPHPMLSDHWLDEGDGCEWIFRVRPGLRFHSGASCDAPAIVAALDHLRDIDGSGRQLWYWDPVDSVTAVGADTIRVRTHYPYSRLPSLLWGTHTAIHCETSRLLDPDAFGYERIDGTGPIQVDRWSPTRLTGRRWPAYPGTPAMFIANRGAALAETVEWFAITDEDARTQALLDGEIDIVHAPALARVDELPLGPTPPGRRPAAAVERVPRTRCPADPARPPRAGDPPGDLHVHRP